MNTVDRLPRNVIKSAVTDLLPKGAPTIARTASLLGVSVRTLQRRLNKNGTSYTMLVDEVRRDTACRLLRAPHARVADVAVALGYADPSSFSPISEPSSTSGWNMRRASAAAMIRTSLPITSTKRC